MSDPVARDSNVRELAAAMGKKVGQLSRSELTKVTPRTDVVSAPYQRFIATKLGDVLSARDFGVAADTATDQSSALNSAIGALLDIQASYSADLKQVCHEIDLGPGTIRLEKPLTPLAAGGRIRGRGAAVTKILGYGAFDLLSMQEFESDGTTRRYYNAMEVSDFAVISSDPLNPLTTAIKLRGLIRNSHIRGVQVQSAAVAFDVDHSWTLVLDHCCSLGSAATQHHILIGANTGALVIDGGRYDAARNYGIYVPNSSDLIELIIQNDCAVQFGSRAAVKIAGARTVKLLGAFFEGNCLGAAGDYHLEIGGTGSALSSCEIVGNVINNLAQPARDGLGVAFIDGFQSVHYDAANRWVRNGVRSYPAFGSNIMQADISLATSHTIAAADLPFLGAGVNRRAIVRQVARPVRFYGGQDMNSGGTFDATKGSAAIGDVGAGQVMLGAYDGKPAIQGYGSGSGFDLYLNPHDGAVWHGRMVGRLVGTSSNWTPVKHADGAVIDTASGNRYVFLDAETWPNGAEVLVWKPAAANNLIFRPAAGVSINGATGDLTKAPSGLYRLRAAPGGWLLTLEPLA